jgi:hypothetical protein
MRRGSPRGVKHHGWGMGLGVIKTPPPVFSTGRLGLMLGLLEASYQPLFPGSRIPSMIIVN